MAGYTTCSSYAFTVPALVEHGRYMQAAGYVPSGDGAGLVAAHVEIVLARMLTVAR